MKKLLAVFLGVLAASGAMAAKPLQVSITPDVSLFGRNETIRGLCLSLWGENPQSALALGVVNGSSGQSAGLSLGLFLNYADSYKGIQFAPINYTKGSYLGWQGGLVNYVDNGMKGLQTGVVNYAGSLTGLQLGVLNYAGTAQTGLQLGLLNLIPSNRWLSGLPNELAPGMVFINWRF
jgi:hypothetical protein